MCEPVVVSVRARRSQPGVAADIREGAVAIVAIQGVRQGLKPLGRANVPRARDAEALARRVVAEGPVDVMTDIKIGKAVAVEVAPGGACAPQVVGEAGGM